ncbi:MAG: hypothetical protein U0235_06730 [Polyangiaceae bacterium]
MLAVGCDKKEDSKPTTTTSPAATSAAAITPPPAASVAAASANAKSFAVAADGKVSIDMPAPNEHIKASAQKAAGELSIDPTNLAATRGAVKVDLTTLKTFTFGDAGKDAKQTDHALNWLEVGSLVTPEEREKNRFIVFTVLGVEGLGHRSHEGGADQDGADDVRTVSAKVKGEVFLHGKKAAREAEVTVTFRGPADKPTRVDIKTVKPFQVVLADHDVKPRDDVGKIAQKAFNLLGTKVADVAAVSLELSAAPK